MEILASEDVENTVWILCIDCLFGVHFSFSSLFYDANLHARAFSQN